MSNFAGIIQPVVFELPHPDEEVPLENFNMMVAAFGEQHGEPERLSPLEVKVHYLCADDKAADTLCGLLERMWKHGPCEYAEIMAVEKENG